MKLISHHLSHAIIIIISIHQNVFVFIDV